MIDISVTFKETVISSLSAFSQIKPFFLVVYFPHEIHDFDIKDILNLFISYKLISFDIILFEQFVHLSQRIVNPP